jgi:transcriptional regulator with XRE-family HTH domain
MNTNDIDPVIISTEATLASIARYLKELRLQQGLSLEEFADLLEKKQIVSGRTYKRYESTSNKTEPSLINGLIILNMLKGRSEDILKLILFPGKYYPYDLATQAYIESLQADSVSTSIEPEEAMLLEIVSACKNNLDLLAPTAAFVKTLANLHQDLSE